MAKSHIQREKSKKQFQITGDNWKMVAFELSKEVLEKCGDKGFRAKVREGFAGNVRFVFDQVFWTFDQVKTFDYPKNWTDAFKLRFFPLWALKLFPAKMTRVVIKEVLPHLPKKWGSKLYKEEKETFIPEIKLEDPEEYDFTFEKFDKPE